MVGPTPSGSVTPTNTPTSTPTNTPTSTPTSTPTATPTTTGGVTPTNTPTATPTTTGAVTPSDTPTATPTTTGGVTPTNTPTATPTTTGAVTPTNTPTATPTTTGAVTPSDTPTATPTTTGGVTPSDTPTPTPGSGSDLDIKISKQDVAGKELAKAELSLTSLDGFDMSGVTVTQGSNAITPRLSADKKTIAFDTVDTSPSVVKGLRAGQYELKETVTPEAYLTADAIRFTLRFDGSIDCSGQITVSGSPIIMVDKADPNYKQNNKPPIPATGETLSLSTIMGFAVLTLALGLTGYGVYRIKKKN